MTEMVDDNVYCVCFGCSNSFYADKVKVPAFCGKCGCRIATIDGGNIGCLQDDTIECTVDTATSDSQPQAPQAPQACNYCSCTVGVRLIPNPYEMRVKGIEIFEYLCWNCESKLNLQAKRDGW